MPPIRLPARFASFSVWVAVSCPWANTAEAAPEAPAAAPVAWPVGSRPAPRFGVEPNTITMNTPNSTTHSMIATGPWPRRNSTSGAR